MAKWRFGDREKLAAEKLQSQVPCPVRETESLGSRRESGELSQEAQETRARSPTSLLDCQSPQVYLQTRGNFQEAFSHLLGSHLERCSSLL